MKKKLLSLSLSFLFIMFTGGIASAAEVTEAREINSVYLDEVESDLLNHGFEIALEKLQDKIKAAPQIKKEVKPLLKFLSEDKNFKKEYGKNEAILKEIKENIKEELDLAKKLISKLEPFLNSLPDEPKYAIFTFYVAHYMTILKEFLENCPTPEQVRSKLEKAFINRRYYVEFKYEFKRTFWEEYVETFCKVCTENSFRMKVNIHMDMLKELEKFLTNYCVKNFFAIDVLNVDGHHYFSNDQIAKNNHTYNVIKDHELLRDIIQDRININEEVFTLQRIGIVRSTNFENFANALELSARFLKKYNTEFADEKLVIEEKNLVKKEVAQTKDDDEKKWALTRLFYKDGPEGYTVNNLRLKSKELKVSITSDDSSGSPKRERKNSFRGRPRALSSGQMKSSVSSSPESPKDSSKESPKLKRRSMSLKKRFSRKTSPDGIEANQASSQENIAKENKNEDHNDVKDYVSPRKNNSPRDKEDTLKEKKRRPRMDQVLSRENIDKEPKNEVLNAVENTVSPRDAGSARERNKSVSRVRHHVRGEQNPIVLPNDDQVTKANW